MTPTAPSPTSNDWKPQLDAYEPSLSNAAAACEKFIADMAAGRRPYWLTLSGVAGSGKTMLARQLTLAAMKFNPGDAPMWVDPEQIPGAARRRPRRIWLDASQFAERLRHGEFDLPEYLADDFLVVLDDLGAARDTTNFVADATYRLCNARRDRWTVFTTNLTLKEIATVIDERVASRLIRDSNSLVTIKAGDYALKANRATIRPKLSGGGLSDPSEPADWRLWLNSAYPAESWAITASKIGWKACPSNWREKIRREMGERPYVDETLL